MFGKIDRRPQIDLQLSQSRALVKAARGGYFPEISLQGASDVRLRNQNALVTRAVREYNEEHPHGALAFLSPDEYRQAYYAGQLTINLKDKLEVTLKAA